MMNKETIDQFYSDLEELNLKFPVAAIAKALGMSKGNVSKYLNKKLDPSEAFLKGFYEKVYKSSKRVSEQGKQGDMQNLLVQLMQKQNQLMEMQNKILEDQKKSVVETVTDTNQNVAKLKRGLQAMQMQLTATRSVVLRSLARLEKKHENALVLEVNKTLGEKGRMKQKPDKHSVEGN